MAGNEERAMIESARLILANITEVIVKPDITEHFELKQYMVQLIQSIGLFVGLPHEDPQRHIQNSLGNYGYLQLSERFQGLCRLTLFPFSLIGEAKEWLNKEPANSIRTWDDLARKFLIMFFPIKKTKVLRSQILGFEQRAGETLRQAWERYKKMLRDCPHHCQTDEVLGYTFVDGLDDASKMNLTQLVGRNHPNFSWGGNQQNQNQHRPQGGFNQPQKPPQQMEESTNELLKMLLINNQQIRTDNQQLRTGFINPERQLGQLATNQNTRPIGALPSDTEKNPQVNAVTLRNGRELEEVPKKRKDKPVPEGELIPKVTNEPKKTAEIPEPVEAPRPPPPFPQRLQKKNADRMFSKFLSMLSQVQLNIPLVDVLREIPKYAKYIKDIVSHKKRLTEFETVALTEECTSRVQNKLPQKLKDPGSFTIPVCIGNVDVGRGLCDLGASINLMTLSLFKQLGLGAPRPTTKMLQLADRSTTHPDGVIEDVLL
ncbi:uncharacterized protein [Nicotiana sylvestris]|uniref:uncharacterized protein n=1 Tax=Nicotiana sylvestris TaxID=4096 RepID=UPI00388CC07E